MRSSRVADLLLVAAGCLAGCGPTPEPNATNHAATTDKATAPDPHGAIDPATGLIRAPGWQHVAGHCNACHSTRHFLRMRGDRAAWDASITWMQKSQGLWPLAPAVREAILSYLATHYGPDTGTGVARSPGATGFAIRRSPLPAALLPPNPYQALPKTGR